MPGYLHSIAMTKRHLILVLAPHRWLDGDGAFFEQMRFTPEAPCRIAVVPKDALDQPRWLEAEFAVAYHFADAYAQRDRIVVRAMVQTDPDEARSPMHAAMHADPQGAPAPVQLRSLHLHSTSGRAHWQAHPVDNLELPVLDRRTPCTQGVRLYAPCIDGPNQSAVPQCRGCLRPGTRPASGASLWRACAGRRTRFFVPRPGSERPDDGWLIGTVLDTQRASAGLMVLDAQHVDAGPVAQAWLPIRCRWDSTATSPPTPRLCNQIDEITNGSRRLRKRNCKRPLRMRCCSIYNIQSDSLLR
ncbi:carotenoid oxygenase family protein [Xanthomonas arboricola]|uniref:carotenoid oxygenase family protein n=1 Tax=Xanthomonas arboricola TaxID=56448 RepID=UPI00142F5D17|nr:carotenoid oxygenase family protein [Xanthomonas arboricola]NJB79309.1 carotenoid cleavage dioxygenase-like enzyme [Xanthomonas arboricola]